MRASVSAPPWLAFSVIVLLLTAFLFYVIFPRSGCDDLAKLSAKEVKGAIECAAKYADGINPATKQPCNVAAVKLCQEDSFSMFGMSFTQAYLGLMVPEYMIYYRKFPTKPFSEARTEFQESYPFERVYHGQRLWDVIPTVTQFKQFFKDSYLLKECTSEPGLCFNIRGSEEVVKIEFPPEADISNVRLNRPGQPLIGAQDNPTFHLVAPCYANVTFKQENREGKTEIYAYVNKQSVDASNYCHTTKETLDAQTGQYGAEIGCEAFMLVADFFTLKSKTAATAAGKEVAKAVVRKEALKDAYRMIKAAVKNALKKSLTRRLGFTKAAKLTDDVVKDSTETFFRKLLVKELREDTVHSVAQGGAVRAVSTAEKSTGLSLFSRFKSGFSKLTAGVVRESQEETLEGATKNAMKKAITEAIKPEDLGKIPLKTIEDSNTLEATLQRCIKQALNDEKVVPMDIAKNVDDSVKDDVAVAIAKDLAKNPDMTFEQAIKQGVDRGITDAATAGGRNIPDTVTRQTASDLAVEPASRTVAATVGEQVASQTSPLYMESVIASYVKDATKRGLTRAQLAGIVARTAATRVWKMEGLPVRGGDQLLRMFGNLGVPCVDLDVCRGLSACGETYLWPGAPFVELTPDKMTGGKSIAAAAEIFFECCEEVNYGPGGDPADIMCEEPEDTVEMIKPELKLNETGNITLAKLADYIGIKPDQIVPTCRLAIGTNSKDCKDSIEVRQAKLIDHCWRDPDSEDGGISSHTFDFGATRSVEYGVTVMARLYEENCPSNIIVEIGNETTKMIEIKRQPALLTSEGEPDSTFVEVKGPLNFRYLRISEDAGCYLESSWVVIDPAADQIIEAEAGVRYELESQNFKHFILPDGFSSSASGLCSKIEGCDTIKILVEEGSWLPYHYDTVLKEAFGNDFHMAGGNEIAIMTNKNSYVVFSG